MQIANGTSTASFFKRVGAAAMAWLGGVELLHWAWTTLDIKSPELVWAYTVCTGFFGLYALAIVCSLRAATLKAEVEQCAAAKSRLEHAVLKKRRSSKKRP